MSLEFILASAFLFPAKECNLFVFSTDMLRQMAELPRMEAMVRTPSLLSYYIASNMPLQDATRQELLEVDGTVYRLRREIELLESMDQLRCKRCLVGQRS